MPTGLCILGTATIAVSHTTIRWSPVGHTTASGTTMNLWTVPDWSQVDAQARVDLLPPLPTPPTPVSRAAHLARVKARGRALALLRSLLPAEQWARWRRHRRLEVTGSDGVRYELSRGVIHNVVELDTAGRPVATWCAHPDGWWLEDDVVVCQLLALTADAAGFRAVANRARVPVV